MPHTEHTRVARREILEAYPDLCFLISPSKTILEVNSHACAFVGTEHNELVGSSFDTVLTIPSRAQFESMLQVCLMGKASHSSEVQLVRRDGSYADAILFASGYTGGLVGNDPAILVVARDVSEEKRRELDLLRFANVAHYTVNPVEITDASGRIVYVNPAFERASGYTKEELIGKNPNIFGSGKQPRNFWKNMWDTITAGRVWMGEIENRRRNGDPFFTQLLISPIVDHDGNVAGFFGVHRDITEQKQLEQQLVHAQKMESIGMLAAGIAHEVGNPLTSISSLVQVIQRTTSDEFVHDKLELVKSQVNRISRIIRDLVDFSRRSSYEVQMTDINRCAREAVEIVRVGRKSKNVEFRLEIDEKLPAIKLVPDQIVQVFVNILINAVDAIHSSAASRQQQRGLVVVTTLINEDHVLIRIRDTGGGIPEDLRPKIFEPFFTTKKVGEGTGLGLWVSYGIVKSFEGDILVDTTPGVGTTFTIQFPLRSKFS
jgi:PAS domain S-box-containing protein